MGTDEALVSVRGEVDLATAPQLESEIETAFLSGIGTVYVDLSACGFIDSSGLGALFRAAELNSNGRPPGEAARRELVLVGMTAQVQRLFDVVGVTEYLPLFGTLAAARSLPRS